MKARGNGDDGRDAQRITGHFYDKYVEYATIAIGLYAAAYGIPEEEVLEMENWPPPGTGAEAGFVILFAG